MPVDSLSQFAGKPWTWLQQRSTEINGRCALRHPLLHACVTTETGHHDQHIKRAKPRMSAFTPVHCWHHWCWHASWRCAWCTRICWKVLQLQRHPWQTTTACAVSFLEAPCRACGHQAAKDACASVCTLAAAAACQYSRSRRPSVAGRAHAASLPIAGARVCPRQHCQWAPAPDPHSPNENMPRVCRPVHTLTICWLPHSALPRTREQHPSPAPCSRTVGCCSQQACASGSIMPPQPSPQPRDTHQKSL